MKDAEGHYYTDCVGTRLTDPDGIYSDDPQACVVCSTLTYRVDVDFEAPLHYDGCRQAMELEYSEAVERLEESLAKRDVPPEWDLN